jgi:WD40 repeat protein
MFVLDEILRVVLLNTNSFATCGLSSLIRIWNIDRKAEIQQLNGYTFYNRLLSLVKIKDEMLASGCEYDGYIQIWNYTRGKLLKNISHSKSIQDLVSLTNGNLASTSAESILIWNTTSWQILNTLIGHERIVTCIENVLDDVLATGSFDRTIRFWNTTTGRNTKTLNREIDLTQCLLFLDSGHLASGEKDSFIKIWNFQTDSLVTYVSGHTQMVTSLVKLKKAHMASTSADMTIKVWNYENADVVALLCTLRGHSNHVNALIELPNGYLASGSLDQTVKIWNLAVVYKYPTRSNLIASVDD